MLLRRIPHWDCSGAIPSVIPLAEYLDRLVFVFRPLFATSLLLDYADQVKCVFLLCALGVRPCAELPRQRDVMRSPVFYVSVDGHLFRSVFLEMWAGLMPER